MCLYGQDAVEAIKTYLPMDGIAMQTLFTVGALFPSVGVAILLKQVVNDVMDFIPFFLGFLFSCRFRIKLNRCCYRWRYVCNYQL